MKAVVIFGVFCACFIGGLVFIDSVCRNNVSFTIQIIVIVVVVTVQMHSHTT